MEKSSPAPCPLLPGVATDMTWRDLQAAQARGPAELHETALRYTQFLWLKEKPARAILALCRALYLNPSSLPASTRQPYPAYAWILLNHQGDSFIGNPRISFFNQATRLRGQQGLKRARAWAMWHLTIRHMSHLPGADPEILAQKPEREQLAVFLDRHGLAEEGADFLMALQLEEIKED